MASTFSRVSKAYATTCRKMKSAVEDGNRRPQERTVVRTVLHYCSVYIPRIRFSVRNGKYRRSELYRLWREQGQGGTLKKESAARPGII